MVSRVLTCKIAGKGCWGNFDREVFIDALQEGVVGTRLLVQQPRRWGFDQAQETFGSGSVPRAGKAVVQPNSKEAFSSTKLLGNMSCTKCWDKCSC